MTAPAAATASTLPTADLAALYRATPAPSALAHRWRAMRAIVLREVGRFLKQPARLGAALVRPLLWLVVFAAGFHNVFGVAIVPPYDTYIDYRLYVVPGLLGMVALFNGMQSSLALVHDRETGAMRLLLTAPLPRSWLLLSKLLAAAALSLLQMGVFAAIAWALDLGLSAGQIVQALPVMLLAALMLAALGLWLSVYVRQLENFAGAMNFVIFPLFFISSALYPLWKLRERGTPLPLYATPEVLGDIGAGFPITGILSHYCGVAAHPLALDGQPLRWGFLDAAHVATMSLSSKPPPYSPWRNAPRPGDNLGVTLVNEASGRRLFYAPGLAEISPEVWAAMQAADVVLVDGTCWTNDEMIRQGLGSKHSLDMGHLPQSGPGGMMEHLARLPASTRKVLIHINNSNPILRDSGPERAQLTAAGIEVAFDGMEIAF